MFETIIQLRPEEDWRPRRTTESSFVRKMERQPLQFPVSRNAWTMPIRRAD